MMKENVGQNIACARAEDLVAYLYGEASEREATEFERHMKECRACSEETAAFMSVREDVLEWRNQSLPSFEAMHNIAQASPEVAMRKRSALAAIREFFTLSPAWMRVATAATMIVICALIVFTVARFYEQPRTIVKVVPTGPTKDEVDALVRKQAEELRRKDLEEKNRQAAIASAQGEQRTTAVANESGERVLPKVKRPSSTSSASTVVKQQRQETHDKISASREAREQLAELVQDSREDDTLPRLSDLIDESNDNQ